MAQDEARPLLAVEGVTLQYKTREHLVTATYRVPLVAPYLASMFAGGRFEFTCSTTMRNEEFPGGA